MYIVGAYHVPIQLVLQNKDDEDIGLPFQGVYVCMCLYFVCVPLNCLTNIIIPNVVRDDGGGVILSRSCRQSANRR